jgi:hypothetical protein
MTKRSPSNLDSQLGSKPNSLADEAFWRVLKKLPTDFEPYGKRKRKGILDCSCKCRWFCKLAGRLGQDWGVCSNSQSPRAGLLTFEHQGCPQYEADDRAE